MWWLLPALALAAPDVDFLHTQDTPKAARYLKVDGTPPRARLKNTKGAWEAWVWRDGRVARARLWDGKTLLEEVRFDGVGDRWATLTYAGGAIAKVTVHGRSDAAVDVGRWATWSFGAASVRLPAVQHGADGSLTAWFGDGVWRASWAPATDVYGDAFRDGLVATCACAIVDRYTVFADGRAGAGYLVTVPGPDAPRLGEVMAFPDPSGTLVVAYTAPTGFLAPGVDDPAVRLAEGRAVVALLAWNPPPKDKAR